MLTAPQGASTTPLAPDDGIVLLEQQSQIMQLIADGAPLTVVLDAVARSLEALMHDVSCSILLLEPGHTTLRHGAAPTLPTQYSTAIDGMAIGPSAGSCGTAAYLGAEVVAEDVRVDPRWAAFRDLAVPHGLLSCWSSPIRGREGTVGTFAVYHRRPHRPTPRERGLVGRFAHLASLAIDHHRLYAALTESEERFRRAFEDNSVGMALTRLDGQVTRSNRALAELLGVTEAELLDQRLAEFVPPDQPERPDRPHDYYQYEATARSADGRPLRLAVAASIVRDADGQPSLRCVNLLDVTQRYRADQERRAREEAEFARRSAEAASTAKSAFVSALSHELRTPLQAITGFTELLGGLDLTPARRQQALAYIGSATNHILALVDDCLDLAKVEAGALAIRPDDVDLATLTGEVVNLLAPLADGRGVAVRADVPPLVLRADPRRLRQVLLNVVGNAVRYNSPGGQVEVSVARTAVGRAELCVTDTGPGIPEELMHRLFVPFDRLGADDGPERGVGLGLVLARSLAEAMEGGLEVASQVGIGTTVRVSMPLAPGDAPTCGTPSAT